jgi:hypothetical protein
VSLSMIARVLWFRRRLGNHERWSLGELQAHQAAELAALASIVARLNDLQPDVLVAYASMIRTLANEQLAGRLRITPRAVNSSSEVLTAEARDMATRAWQAPPVQRLRRHRNRRHRRRMQPASRPAPVRGPGNPRSRRRQLPTPGPTASPATGCSSPSCSAGRSH